MQSGKINFSQNTNPFGPPKWLNAFIRRNISQISQYPDYTNAEVNKEIARFFNVSVGNAAFANGSMEAIFASPFIVDTSRSIIVVPTFWGYAAALESGDSSFKRFALNENDNFRIDALKLDEIAKMSTSVFLCNPNNPTGFFISRESLLPVIKSNPGCHFFIDETHLLFMSNFKKHSLFNEVENLNNLTITYSTSKLYNVGGLRTGMVLSNTETIAKFKRAQVPYSSGTLSQLVLIELLKDRKFLYQTRVTIEGLSAELFFKLSKIAWLKTIPTHTHFILGKITDSTISAQSLAEYLLKNGLIIRTFSNHADIKGEWIRIAVNKEGENIKLIKALSRYQENKNEKR